MSERKHSQCNDFLGLKDKMNNKIIEADMMPDLHREGRQIGMTNCQQRDMTMCLQGTRILHKTKGEENFGVFEMVDKNGDMPPRSTVNCIRVWFIMV